MSTYVVIELDIHKRRYICQECSNKKGKQTTFVERFSFLENRHHHTNFFESFILQEWKYLSVLELSRKFHVSDKMIWDIIKNIHSDDILKRNISSLMNLSEIYLGIDEHSFRGHDYVLIITELKTGQVIGVLPKITKVDLEEWLNSLPPKIMVKIKGYATDMHKGYASTVKEVLGGKPLHTVDPAHLVFLANRVTDQVRQMNDWMIKMGYYEKDRKIDLSTKYGLKRGKKPKKVSQPKLKEEHEIEPMEYRLLFLTGEESLSDKQKNRINQLFKASDPKKYVFDAWSQKELVREALQSKNIKLIDKVIKELLESEHCLIKGLGKTLRKWAPDLAVDDHLHEAGVLAHKFGQMGQEGDDVVLHLAFDLVDAIDVELHVPGFPDRLGGVGGHHAQLGQLVGGVGLDLEPDAVFGLGRPDVGHFRPGIARDHGARLSRLAKRAGLRANSANRPAASSPRLQITLERIARRDKQRRRQGESTTARHQRQSQGFAFTVALAQEV